MSLKTEEALVVNSGYGSGDETSTLLAKGSGTKPVLTRQDCTTSLVVSPPHLSASGTLMGNSDESGPGGLPEEARSVPDIELHCRTRCRPCERRRSTAIVVARSASRESVQPPAVLLTASPSRHIVRQSSQPESTCHCCHHHLHHTSLRQLPAADPIAMIAADSLRINGAIRQFKQVSFYRVPFTTRFKTLLDGPEPSTAPCTAWHLLPLRL